MDRMIKRPNLPEKDITALAMGEKYIPLFASFFEERGVALLPIPANPFVDPRLAYHADLTLLHLNMQMFATVGELFIPLPVSCASILRMQTMEEESALNICIVGDYSICNEETSGMRLSWLKRIPVKQRYARCSICVVDEHSIITADHGIAKSCQGLLDVLEIESGHIELPGFDYGFIGGCSFKLNAHELAFTGNLRDHPDAGRIESFLRERGVESVCMRDGPLLDIGSAVPVQEKF